MEKYKLGVAYNLFDGEELLFFSVKQIRKQVDYIVVIWQKISNNGESVEDNVELLLHDLKERNLIDDYYCYTPILNKSASYNERLKRDTGLRYVKNAGCSHFLSMDVDEFYDEKEFIFAKNYIFNNNIKSSACSILEYIKKPEYLIENGYLYNNNFGSRYCFYVPFIMDISELDIEEKEFHKGEYFPVLVDPTRRLNGNLKFHLFSKHDLVMHHMSTIRKNLWKKYRNSSYNVCNKDTKNLVDEIRKDVLNFDFSKNKLSDNIALFRGLIIRLVPNRFNINFSVENDIKEDVEKKLSDIQYILTQKIIELDRSNNKITDLNNAVKDKDNKIKKLDNAVKDKDNRIKSLDNTVKDRDNQIKNLNNTVKDGDNQITIQDQVIKRLQNSWSYRIGRLFTYPLSIPLEFYKFIRDYNLLKKSDLFDSEYYLSQNEDVKKAKINPIKHYLKFGWKEGRNPSEKFNGNDYLNKRPDVRVAGICPLVHYLKFGKNEYD